MLVEGSALNRASVPLHSVLGRENTMKREEKAGEIQILGRRLKIPSEHDKHCNHDGTALATLAGPVNSLSRMREMLTGLSFPAELFAIGR